MNGLRLSSVQVITVSTSVPANTVSRRVSVGFRDSDIKFQPGANGIEKVAGVGVGVAVGVGRGVGVDVGLGARLGVAVGVGRGVGVDVGVGGGVGVAVGVGRGVGVNVGVGVGGSGVEVGASVGVGVSIGVLVGVGPGWAQAVSSPTPTSTMVSQSDRMGAHTRHRGSGAQTWDPRRHRSEVRADGDDPAAGAHPAD